MHHGLRSPAVLEIVDVLVPAGRRRNSIGFVRLHRTARLPDQIVSSGPLRLAEVARAVADTVRLLADLRDVRAVVADAVQRGRCTVGDLATELRTIPCPGSPAASQWLSSLPQRMGREGQPLVPVPALRAEGRAGGAGGARAGAGLGRGGGGGREGRRVGRVG